MTACTLPGLCRRPLLPSLHTLRCVSFERRLREKPCTRRMLCMSANLKALVYNGDGGGMRCILSTYESLERCVKNLQVEYVSKQGLLDGALNSSCALLVMPGGADLPYCRDLNGRGNQLIREWVEAGGAYLGLCAGAYYACSQVVFEASDPALRVVGDRELKFFDGTAQGAAYPGFDYGSEQGAVAAPIWFRTDYQLVPDTATTHVNAAAAETMRINGSSSSSTARLRSHHLRFDSHDAAKAAAAAYSPHCNHNSNGHAHASPAGGMVSSLPAKVNLPDLPDLSGSAASNHCTPPMFQAHPELAPEVRGAAGRTGTAAAAGVAGAAGVDFGAAGAAAAYQGSAVAPHDALGTATASTPINTHQQLPHLGNHRHVASIISTAPTTTSASTISTSTTMTYTAAQYNAAATSTAPSGPTHSMNLPSTSLKTTAAAEDAATAGSWQLCYDYSNGGPVFIPNPWSLEGDADHGVLDQAQQHQHQHQQHQQHQHQHRFVESAQRPQLAGLTPSSARLHPPAAGFHHISPPPSVPLQSEGTSSSNSTGASLGRRTQQAEAGGNGTVSAIERQAELGICNSGCALVLARYAGLKGQPAAAVRCQVGAGVAVLCGTHPELDTKWLKSSINSCSDAGIVQHMQQLVQQLDAAGSQRQAFWQLLLAACCSDIGLRPSAVSK